MALTLNGTTGEIFPSWATAGRPASPSAGQVGYNTTTGTLDVYGGTGWQQASFDGPTFAAYATAGVSLANNTWTKIPLQAEYFDTANAFDSSSNYRFQPTVAGYYQINGAVSNGAFNGGVAAAGIYKNGTVIAKSLITNGGQGTVNTVSMIVSLNGSTDYIELYGFQNSGGALSTASSADTNLSGAFLRGL